MRSLLLSCDTERDTEQDIPREPFTGMASSTPLNPYRDSSELTFLVEDEIYNVKDVQAEGICQPIKSGVCS